MALDPQSITPGVYEAQHPTAGTQLAIARIGSVSIGVHFFATVAEAVERGWTFARRYIPCDIEPVECWGIVWEDGTVTIDGDEPFTGALTGGRVVRGVFVPQESREVKEKL